MVERVLESKINICSECGKEITTCDRCNRPIELDDEVVCLVVGFDEVKHYHNIYTCFPNLNKGLNKGLK